MWKTPRRVIHTRGFNEGRIWRLRASGHGWVFRRARAATRTATAATWCSSASRAGRPRRGLRRLLRGRCAARSPATVGTRPRSLTGEGRRPRWRCAGRGWPTRACGGGTISGPVPSGCRDWSPHFASWRRISSTIPARSAIGDPPRSAPGACLMGMRRSLASSTSIWAPRDTRPAGQHIQAVAVDHESEVGAEVAAAVVVALRGRATTTAAALRLTSATAPSHVLPAGRGPRRGVLLAELPPHPHQARTRRKAGQVSRSLTWRGSLEQIRRQTAKWGDPSRHPDGTGVAPSACAGRLNGRRPLRSDCEDAFRRGTLAAHLPRREPRPSPRTAPPGVELHQVAAVAMQWVAARARQVSHDQETLRHETPRG